MERCTALSHIQTCVVVFSGGIAPKYQTAYACEGKNLTIECDPGDIINLIRANYGRFSITICNDHGNVEWSVNCMFPKSLTVLNSRCAHKQSCSVLATTYMFGDPCPGTHKYLEAHYQCISATQTSTTTSRPNIPWVLTNTPQLLVNGSTGGIINPSNSGGVTPVLLPAIPPRLLTLPVDSNNLGGMVVTSSHGGSFSHGLSSSTGPPTIHTTLPGGRLKGNYNATAAKITNRHDGLPPPPPLHHHYNNGHSSGAEAIVGETLRNRTSTAPSATLNSPTPSNTRILIGVGGAGSENGSLLNNKNTQNGGNQVLQSPQPPTSGTITSTMAAINGDASTVGSGSKFSDGIRTITNINNLNVGLVSDDSDVNLYCGPTNARNLFWNITRVGDVNVQPCPDGATGIAKWRCVLMKRISDFNLDDDISSTESPVTRSAFVSCNNTVGQNNCMQQLTTLANKDNSRIRHFEPTWHPITPDLTQCRSLWLSNLEVRVNQRDSSLISIANDLSEVTSSKTLYGGDMLVTTKIVQIMSEKMYHDKETFPDQRQREAIILELLHGVVKTGSNLLDESQLSSWLDLNQEDQMRVATSLLTGLEYNAFLLADTIIRERNVVQKVKNILLSVRVLEAKNIQTNEVFPDAEQWQVSDDRIELPRAALIENSEGGLVRIVFAAFDRLESILKPSYDYFDLKSARSSVRNTAILANATESADFLEQKQHIRILNSKVISASLGKGRHIQLSQPIKLVLKHLKTENVTNPTCVFWNYIDHAWSANGCNLVATNRTHSICTCNHLTNFAILMDVMDEHIHSLFTMFDGNMRILIYISISICLVFIVIALLTLKIFNGVFIKSARISIYRSIYICLLFVEILFLIGIEQTETSILCGFTTVFLHCSILSAIAWFCFEAFQSYSTLITDDMLLEVDQTSKVNCYYLLSYGLSLTIVAISLAINPNSYTQNDFCVLMEASTLFYATFITPVMIFLLGAIGYSLLSWLIICRKTRLTLKNKEHTRLANVRFDMRCSFIFLLLLCAICVSAYYYLRRAKVDDEICIAFGYLFVGFNTLMGLFIFVFHCIQNEKIRREYRKYVRKNSWLPKCLRCSKTSVSSGIIGNNGIGGGGTISSNKVGSSFTGTQIKSKIPPSAGEANENNDPGCIISTAEDTIIGTSDCELTEGQQIKRTAGNTLKSSIVPGSMMLQDGKANSIIEPAQSQIVIERVGGNGSMGGPGASSTLLSTGGVHTPSAGHTSPTSSADSTHLIFGHGYKQQTHATAGSVGSQEAFYHQPDSYHSWRQHKQSSSGKSSSRDYHTGALSQPQAHEFFYWTQKYNQRDSKKKRGSAAGLGSPNGSLHSRTTATSHQILFYPSYKKTSHSKNQQHQQLDQYQRQYPHHYAEAIEPNAAAVYSQQQCRQQAPIHSHLQQQYLQQQQLSSDDEQMESAAHAHLLQFSQRGGLPQLPPLPPTTAVHPYAVPPNYEEQHSAIAHRYYRNKQSNCDLNHLQQRDNAADHLGGEPYYNQGALSGGADGPVYEEILSNRTSVVQHFDDDNTALASSTKCGFGAGFKEGKSRTEVSGMPRRQNSRRQQPHRSKLHLGQRQKNTINVTVTDDDNDDDSSVFDEGKDDVDDDDEEEDEDFDMQVHNDSLSQSDDRMRHLMAMQDEDFQRRFQRQLQLQQHQNHPSDATVFGVSGGVGSGGPVRSFKKTVSPIKRLAANELFGKHGNGPPLPPANQYSKQKRQQHPQQQQPDLSPQSITSTSSLSLMHLQQQLPVQQQQQQPIGRNISAMLDENNTVRCYLEPLTK